MTLLSSALNLKIQCQEVIGLTASTQVDRFSSLSVWVLSLMSSPQGSTMVPDMQHICVQFPHNRSKACYFKAVSAIKRSSCQNPYVSFVTKLYKYLCFPFDLAVRQTFRFFTALALKCLLVSFCRLFTIYCDSLKWVLSFWRRVPKLLFKRPIIG